MDDMLTDDHVAELLVKDAQEHALRYSAMGLEAYRTPRPAAKAKPNTRFLRNIIRETKHHNEALLAREAAEATARLEGLAEARAREDRKRRPSAADLRRRQLGAISATLQAGGGGRKRKLAPDEGEGQGDGRSSRKRDPARPGPHGEYAARRAGRPGRGAGEEEEPGRGRERDGAEGRRRGRSSDEDENTKEEEEESGGKHPRRGSRRPRSRSRSPGHRDRKSRHAHGHSRHHHHHRSRSPRATDTTEADHRRPRGRREHSRDAHTHASSSPRDDTHRRHHQHHHPKRRNSHPQDDPDPADDDADSDPLEALIGPQPPAVRRRGRGGGGGPSAMDGHFSAGYDPRADVDAVGDYSRDGGDGDDDDWGDALEALRDRDTWRRRGAARLRAAGFDEAQVRAWEGRDGGARRERDVADVRWAGPGERREWDRGKVGTATAAAWVDGGQMVSVGEGGKRLGLGGK